MTSVVAENESYPVLPSSMDASNSRYVPSKPPNFLGLPTETRIQIYTEVFRGHQVLARPTVPPHASEADFALASICKVCRTCLAEAQPVLFATIICRFEFRLAFDMLQMRIGKPTVSLIHHISIDAACFNGSGVDLLGRFPVLQSITMDLKPCRWPHSTSVIFQLACKNRMVISGPFVPHGLTTYLANIHGKFIKKNPGPRVDDFRPMSLLSGYARWVRRLVVEIVGVAPARRVELVMRMRLECWDEVRKYTGTLNDGTWDSVTDLIEIAVSSAMRGWYSRGPS